MSASLPVVAISVVMGCGLWPFGGDGNRQAHDRIGDLEERQIEVKAEPDIASSSQLAREQYQLFLDMSAGNPVPGASRRPPLRDHRR